MNCATYTIYDLQTGLFGAVLSLPDDETQRTANTPPGCGLARGVFDGRTQRIDVLSGEVLPYRPPAPPDDADNTWRWDDERLRWAPVATAERAAREERARRATKALALEAGQGRALRALALNPSDEQARAKLEEIEAAIASLGIRE